MTRRNRLIALLLAVIVLFVMAFSLFVVAAEAGHDCHSEDCPVCELIAVCENNVRVMSLVLVFVTMIVVLALKRKFTTYSHPFVFDSQTPVLLKVKLTD